MKKLLLALSILTFGAGAMAQQVKIVKKSDPATAINGTEVTVYANENDVDVKAEMEFINIGTVQKDFRIKRVKLESWDGLDQICDDQLCYNASNTTSFTTPIEITLNPSDTSLLKPQVQPGGDSFCAIYRYYIIDAFNIELDSVDVKYVVGTANECFLSTEEEIVPDFTVYPNPAKDELTISFDGNTADYGLRIVDILGNVVYDEASISAYKIDISHLNSGVYFYSLVKEGEAIKTQRLVVKK